MKQDSGARGAGKYFCEILHSLLVCAISLLSLSFTFCFGFPGRWHPRNEQGPLAGVQRLGCIGNILGHSKVFGSSRVFWAGQCGARLLKPTLPTTGSASCCFTCRATRSCSFCDLLGLLFLVLQLSFVRAAVQSKQSAVLSCKLTLKNPQNPNKRGH